MRKRNNRKIRIKYLLTGFLRDRQQAGEAIQSISSTHASYQILTRLPRPEYRTRNNQFTQTMSNSSIRVISGCMFSGKTSRLLWYLKRAQIADRKVILFKPKLDNRYSETDVVTHDNNRLASIVIEDPEHILAAAADYEVVGIDEIHFFPAEKLTDTSISICVYSK